VGGLRGRFSAREVQHRRRQLERACVEQFFLCCAARRARGRSRRGQLEQRQRKLVFVFRT
jgi:hypothetical protein